MASSRPNKKVSLEIARAKVSEALSSCGWTLRNFVLEGAIDSLVYERAENLYSRLLVHLMSPQHGLRVPAEKFTIADIERVSRDNLAELYATKAPELWWLITRLLDANKSQRAREIAPDVRGRKQGGGEGAAAVSSASVPGSDPSPIAKRNRDLVTVKAMQIISIMIQSSNQTMNLLQAVWSIFLSATSTSEAVRLMLAHGGLAISLPSTEAMLDAVRTSAEKELKRIGLTGIAAFAFDNLEVLLRVGQMTLTREGNLESIATGIVFLLEHGVLLEHLRCAELLWNSNPLNSKRPEGVRIKEPTADNTRLRPETQAAVRRAFEWHVLAILVEEYFPEFVDKLGRPSSESSLQIPVKKTTALPAKAMRAKVSSNDGNIEALKSMLNQMGRTKQSASEFVKEHVILVNGDLGVVERILACQRFRSIEPSAYERLAFLIVIPGLFHIKMAAADALKRIYIEPGTKNDGSVDPAAIRQHVESLNPKHHAKLANNPGFRMLHDSFQLTTRASTLEAWRVESGKASLDAFVRTNPSLESLQKMAKSIVSKWAKRAVEEERMGVDADRDVRVENSALYFRDGLLYTILSDAMNHGEVGLVEDVLWYWIPIFKGCGKHKYSNHLTTFLFNLREVYPPNLARAIRLNWLCNPTGRPDGFRAVDWVVELYNLYHKAVMPNGGPNDTIDRIISQSILIRLYRQVIDKMEDEYLVTKRTVHHTSPERKEEMRKLMDKMKTTEAFLFKKGRKVAEIKDSLSAGLNELRKRSQWRNVTEEEVAAEGVTVHEVEEVGEGSVGSDSEETNSDVVTEGEGEEDEGEFWTGSLSDDEIEADDLFTN